MPESVGDYNHKMLRKMWGNAHVQLQQRTKEFDFFSFLSTVDDSPDVQDTVQLLIFIRGVSANFEMC